MVSGGICGPFSGFPAGALMAPARGGRAPREANTEDTTMKAMVLDTKHGLKLAEVQRPAITGDQALVQITQSAICGPD